MKTVDSRGSSRRAFLAGAFATCTRGCVWYAQIGGGRGRGRPAETKVLSSELQDAATPFYNLRSGKLCTHLSYPEECLGKYAGPEHRPMGMSHGQQLFMRSVLDSERGCRSSGDHSIFSPRGGRRASPICSPSPSPFPSAASSHPSELARTRASRSRAAGLTWLMLYKRGERRD